MADYYCLYCGGRTSLMGHGERHDERLAALADRLSDELGIKRPRAVEVIGKWQMGEISLP